MVDEKTNGIYPFAKRLNGYLTAQFMRIYKLTQ
jgi:hypothetical protein